MRILSVWLVFSLFGTLMATVETPAKIDTKDCRFSDVENIGNREINHRIYLVFPNFISYDKEIQLGAQFAAEVEHSAKLLEDSATTEYCRSLVQVLVRHSDAKVPFTIKVIDSDEINAFALPGGFLFINKGLIQAAETEDELVGVICHEIAHVAARHATERMTKAQLLNYAAIPSIFVGGVGGMLLRNGIGLAMDLKILGITRSAEEEADILGSQYAWHAGYDPNGFITFFNKMLANEKKQPGKLASWFRTHPATPTRIEYTQRSIDRCLPEKDRYIVTSAQFDVIKSRLTEYDNVQLANNPTAKNAPGKGGRGGKPTLKRRTDTDDDKDGTKPDTPPDSKPTLKRDKDDSDFLFR